jgi:cell division protein FtsB
MRQIFIILIIALVILQHKLWLGDGSIVQWVNVEQKLKKQESHNKELALRNKSLENDIKALKNGNQAIEEQARYELGMVKENETYYQFAE